MASIRKYLSAGASNLIGLIRDLLGLPFKIAKLGWSGLKWLTKSLWWWGLLTVRFFGRHYVWLFLLMFFVWMWWQGGHLLLTMSSLITGYSTRLIEDGSAGQNYEGIRNLLLGLAALLSVPFFFLRTWINERQTRTQEQGHMTDRIATAVAALGTEKQVKNTISDADHGQQTVEITVPNLEVRIGAVYALERISQDSARDHWQVMEILTAYLRENAKDWPKQPPPKLHDRENLSRWWAKQDPVRIDIQTVVSVLARRSAARRLEEERRLLKLDLRGVHLIEPEFRSMSGKADLSKAIFRNGACYSANFHRVKLRAANFDGANLARAFLNEADLRNAEFYGAILHEAHLVKADLTGAELTESNLSWAKLTEANLSGATLTGATLIRADLKGANLSKTNFNDNTSLVDSCGLCHTKNLHEARLPEGWSVNWNKEGVAWDITTPDGPYVDPQERDYKWPSRPLSPAPTA